MSNGPAQTHEQQLAITTLQFLQRAELKGTEVDAFGAVRQWLIGIAQPQPPAQPVAEAATTDADRPADQADEAAAA